MSNAQLLFGVVTSPTAMFLLAILLGVSVYTWWIERKPTGDFPEVDQFERMRAAIRGRQ